MAHVEKRAKKFVAKTKQVSNVGYDQAKPPTTQANPRATVASKNAGVLKGPTSRGHRN